MFLLNATSCCTPDYDKATVRRILFLWLLCT